MALAMSLPTTILTVVWGAMQLEQKHILNQSEAYFLILGVICGMLILMVYYAYRRKN